MTSNGEAPNDALGFTFTETMEGYVGEGAESYRVGARRGKAAGAHVKFRVTMHMADLRSFLADPEHAAVMTGIVNIAGMEETEIREGVFNLLARGEDGHRQMRYSFLFDDAGGATQKLEGFKDVHNDWTFDFWKDTTTLFTTVTPENAEEGTAGSRGILRIKPLALIPQALSFRALNTKNPLRHVQATARFSAFFMGNLWDEYHPRLRIPFRRKSSARRP